MSQPSRKVTDAQRRQIRQLAQQGLSVKEISERTGIDGRIVSGIVSKMRDAGSISGPASRPKPGNSRVYRGGPGSRATRTRQSGTQASHNQVLNVLKAVQTGHDIYDPNLSQADLLRLVSGMVKAGAGTGIRSRHTEHDDPYNVVRKVLGEVERMRRREFDRIKEEKEEERRRQEAKEEDERGRKEHERRIKRMREDNERDNQSRKKFLESFLRNSKEHDTRIAEIQNRGLDEREAALEKTEAKLKAAQEEVLQDEYEEEEYEEDYEEDEEDYEEEEYTYENLPEELKQECRQCQHFSFIYKRCRLDFCPRDA